MKFRYFALILLLAMSVFAVTAQDGGLDTCFNLADADCQFLTAAGENTATNIASFNSNFTIDFSAAGLGLLDPTLGDITLSIKGSGPINITPEGETPFEGSLNLTVVSTGMGDDDVNSEIQLILVDNMAYANVDGEWQEPQDATELFADMGTDPADLEALADPQALAGLQLFTSIPGFIDHQRLADEDMMGQTVVPFQLSMNFTELFQSDMMQAMLPQITTALPQDDPNMALAGQMIPLLAEALDAQLAVTQFVGADDNFVHRLAIDLDANIDMGAIMGADGMPPIEVFFDMGFDLNDINGSFAITAPAID